MAGEWPRMKLRDRLLIGYSAIVPLGFENGSIFTHHLYRLRPRNDSWLTADYLCHLLNTGEMHEIVSGYANGTTVNMLPIDALQSPLVLVPPARLVAMLSAMAAGARRRHEEMRAESRTLSALRDALLPKLISGDLPVKGAERFIEAAP